jgi:hypothetical protein
MSTSPANADDRLGRVSQVDHAAQSFSGAQDQGLRGAFASVPDFAFAAGAGHPADGMKDDAESPQTSHYIQAAEPRAQRLHGRDRSPPRGLSPASVTVMSNRGYERSYVDLRMQRSTLRRRGRGLARVKKLLVTGAIGATVAGCIAVEIWLLVGDSDLAGPPQPAARLPLPGALPPELRALMAASEAVRVASPQSAASLQPTAQPEDQQGESRIAASRIEARLAQTPAGSAYERPQAPRPAVPQFNPISRPEPPTIARPQPIPALEPPSIAIASSTREKMEPSSTTAPRPRSTATSDSTAIAGPDPTAAAAPETRAIAMAESTWIGRLGPALESPRINQAPPRLAKAADGAGLPFKDSNVRYLSRAELQTLSADQLHLARNEIFARRGRFFKDDALRAYFLQFAWYRPHAWEVPLSSVEQANVALIQSVEDANIGSASPSEAPVAASRGIANPPPAQTKAENGNPFADTGRRYLTPEELQGLSADQLAIVRNRIFARRGRYFKDDWLRAYFSQFPWYRPYAWEVPLSPLEQANVKLVQSLEQTAAAPRPASRMWRGPP